MQSTSEIPFPYNITIYKGSSFKRTFQLFDTSDPAVPLAPLSDFEAFSQFKDEDGNVLFTFDTAINVSLSTVSISLDATATDDLAEVTGYYDIVLKKFTYVSPPVITGEGTITSTVTDVG